VKAVSLGRFRVVIPEEDGGREALEAALPRRNSLRRAGDEARMAVAAAAMALSGEGQAVTERTGIYVGQQQGSLEGTAGFLEASHRDGPRLASPALFAESVANSTATHLSLTFGVRGSVQTFIGSRAAGIQAVAAAAEDLEEGVTDAALVVVVGVSSTLTRHAYESLHFPFARDRRPSTLAGRNGAAAFVARRGEGPATLRYANARCSGRGRRAVVAVRSLWEDSGAVAPRVLASVFSLARPSALSVLREGLGEGTELDPGPEDRGESFALDPFLLLARDAGRSPGPRLRAVACLGEEGTAGLLVVEGDPRGA